MTNRALLTLDDLKFIIHEIKKNTVVGAPLLSAKELKQKLRLTQRQMYKLLVSGLPRIKLPGLGKGSIYRYDYEEVLEWLKTNKN